VDYNKNGTIEALEVEVAILNLYNIINKRLPGWQDPPKRDAVLAALKLYDVDGSGHLNKEEFFQFSKSLVRPWWDAALGGGGGGAAGAGVGSQAGHPPSARRGRRLLQGQQRAPRHAGAVLQVKSGPDMFFTRVGKDAVVQTALLPAISMGIQVRGRGGGGAGRRRRRLAWSPGAGAAADPRCTLTALPAAAPPAALQKTLPGASEAPLAVLAPAVGVAVRAFKALMPV
jgi:hypothetical protein